MLQADSRIPSPEDDASCFEQLYADYFPRVHKYVRYRIEDAQDADDLTSQIFIKLLSGLKGYRPEQAPLFAWVFTIARNTLTDHYRRRARDFCAPLEEDGPWMDCQPGPDEIVSFNETRRHLYGALACLSTREREIIELKFWGGFSNREIAGIFRISDSNTGVILYRAMRRLRRILESRGECAGGIAQCGMRF